MHSKAGVGASDGEVGADDIEVSLSSQVLFICDRFGGDVRFTWVLESTTISSSSSTVAGANSGISAFSSDTVRLRVVAARLAVGFGIEGTIFVGAAFALAVFAFRVCSFDTCVIFLGESGVAFVAVPLVRLADLSSATGCCLIPPSLITPAFLPRVALVGLHDSRASSETAGMFFFARLVDDVILTRCTTGFLWTSTISVSSICRADAGIGEGAAFLPLVVLGIVSDSTLLAVGLRIGFFRSVLLGSDVAAISACGS